MKKVELASVLASEIRRLETETSDLDRQIRDLESRREKLQLLLRALQGLVNQAPVPKSSEKVRETVSHRELKVGLPVRMLQGIYGGLEGTIRWCRESPRGMICTLSLRQPGGRTRRTQVTERSLGEKWILLGDEGRMAESAPPKGQKEPGARGTAPRKASGRRTGKAGRGRGRKEPDARRARRPEALLQRDTRVRVLTGKYANWEGFISGIRDKQTAVTYALTLEGPGGEKGRTQVNHGSLGASWVLLDGGAGASIQQVP